MAIFTATKVGKREDELFVENMDSIDILPPGLYELVVDTPEGEEVSGKLRSHYEARTIEDIRALGYNSVEDDRAFATVAKASEALSYMYDKLVHPWFNIYNTPEVADRLKNFRPLRLSYTLFADSVNPWMKFFEDAAVKAEQERVQLDESNLFLQMQQESSNFITQYLQNIANFRDSIREQMFFNIWSNPLVQKFWGTDSGAPRYTPSMTQFDRDELMKNYQAEIKRNLPVRNKVEALFRFIALIQAQRNKLQEFVIRVLVHKARELEPKWSDRDFHEVIKAQAMVVRNDPDAALIALKSFVDKANNTAELSATVRDVIDKIGDLPTEVMDIARSIAAKLSE